MKHSFDHVVYATGRTGYNALVNNSQEIRIDSTPPKVSVGFRIELPSSALSAMFEAHKDFKFTKRYAGHKVKSFCFSSSKEHGGRLKFCHYPNQFEQPITLLDGHANYDDVGATTPDEPYFGNIGLLIQALDERDSLRLMRNFVENYTALSEGNPVYQCLENFLERRAGEEPNPVSVKDIRPARLDRLFSDGQLAAFGHAIYELFQGISENSAFSVQELAKMTNCVGPELEFFWPTVKVDSNLQTTTEGLYVAGDALGLAQGIFQAAVTGIAVARGIERSQFGYDRMLDVAAE